MAIETYGTKDKIISKIKEALSAVYVDVIDESFKHVGHAGAAQGGHFILKVVSDRFNGVSLIDRNRFIYRLLEEEMKGEIHAITIRAMTAEEWESSRAG